MDKQKLRLHKRGMIKNLYVFDYDEIAIINIIYWKLIETVEEKYEF